MNVDTGFDFLRDASKHCFHTRFLKENDVSVNVFSLHCGIGKKSASGCIILEHKLIFKKDNASVISSKAMLIKCNINKILFN